MNNFTPLYYPWQQIAWQQLIQRYCEGHFPQALLLDGLKDSGKFDFVQGLSQWLLCQNFEQKQHSQLPCHNCKSCRLMQQGTHPDYHLVTLPKDAKIIKIDVMRELINQLACCSNYTSMQLVVIYPADHLNHAAANALLKNLEEPAGKQTIFLLVSHQRMNLPATVRSRCQIMTLPVPNKSQLKNWLMQTGISIKEQQFELGFFITQGAPLALRTFLVEPDSKSVWRLYNDLRSIMLLNAKFNITQLSQTYADIKVEEIVFALQLFVFESIRHGIGFKLARLFDLYDQLNQTKTVVLNQVSLNSQLLLEYYLIQWQKTIINYECIYD